MHERTNIRLSAADRSELETVAANRNSPQKHVWRAKIVLLTADGHGTADIMRATGKAKTVIWRWQERFGEEGVTGLWRDKTRPARIPPLRPEVAENDVGSAMTIGRQKHNLRPPNVLLRAVAVGRHRLKLAAVGGTQSNVGSLVHSSDSHTRVHQRMPKRIEMSDLVH